MSVVDIIPFPCDPTCSQVPNISFWDHQEKSVEMSANKKHKETRLVQAHLSPTPTRVVRIPATDVSAARRAAQRARKATIRQLLTVAPSVRAAAAGMEKIQFRNRTFARWLIKCGRERRKLLLRELRSDLINNGLPRVQLREALRQLAQQTVVCVERLTDTEINLHTKRNIIGGRECCASYMQEHDQKCNENRECYEQREDMNKEKHKHEKGHGCATNNHLQIKNVNSLKRPCEGHDYHKMVEKSIGRAKFKKFKDKEETKLHKHETSTHTKTETYFSDKNNIKNGQLCSDSKCENAKNSCPTKVRPDCIAAKRTSDAKCGVTNCKVTEEQHKKNSYQENARFPDLSASNIDKYKTTEQTGEYVSSENCNSDDPKMLQPDGSKVLIETKINRQPVAPVTSTSKIVKGRLSELSHKSSLLCDRTSTASISVQKSVHTCTNAETSSQISKSSGQILSVPSKTFCPETVMSSNVPVDGNSSSSHVDDGARKSDDPKMGQPAAIPVASAANDIECHVAVAGRKSEAVVGTDNTDVDMSSESSINEQMASRNIHESRDKEVEESNACIQDRERGEKCLRLKETECDRDKSENHISSHTKGFQLCEHSKNMHGNTLFNHSTAVNQSKVLNKVDLASSASAANDEDVALCRNKKRSLTVENKVNDTATCELKDNITGNVASGITAASPMVEDVVENQYQISESVISGITNSNSGHTQKSNSSRDNFENIQVSDTFHGTKLQGKTRCSTAESNESSLLTGTKQVELRLTPVIRQISCSSGSSTDKQHNHTENCKKKGCTMPLESTVHTDREGQHMNNRENIEPGFVSTKDHSVNYTPCKTKTSRKIETSLKRPCVQEQHETDCQRKRLKEVSRTSESGKRKSKLSMKLEELFGVDECDDDDISGGHTNSPKISKTQNLPDVNKESPEIGRKSTASPTVEQCKLLPSSRENSDVKKSSLLDSNKTRAPDLKAKVLLAKPKLKQKLEQSLVNRETKRGDKEEGTTGKSQYSERSKSAKEKVMENWFSDATNPPACSKSRCTEKDTAAVNPHNIPWQLKKVDLPNVSPKSRKDYYRKNSEKSHKPVVAKVGIHKRNSFPPMPNNKSCTVDVQTLVRNDDILSSAVQGRRHSDTEFNGINVNDKSERLIESCEPVLKLQTNTVSEKIGTLPGDVEGERNFSTSNEEGALPIPHTINSPHNQNLGTENVEVSLTSVVVKDEEKVHDANEELSAEQQDEEKVDDENDELLAEQQDKEKVCDENEELSAEQQDEEKVCDENEELAAEHHISESEPLNSSIVSRNNESIETTPSVEGNSSPALLSATDDNLESLEEGGAERKVMENRKESVSAERLCLEIGMGVITEETKQSLHAEPSVQSVIETINDEQRPKESIIKEEPKDVDTSKKNENTISLEPNSEVTKETLSVINNELENEPGTNKDKSENPVCNLQLEENRLQRDGAEAIPCINKIGSIRVKDPLTLGIDIKRLEPDSATREIEDYVKMFPQQIQDDLNDLTSLFITGFMDFDRYKARKNDAARLRGTSREIELTNAHKDLVLSFESKCRVVIKKVNFLKIYFGDKFEQVLHTYVNKKRRCTTRELGLLYQTFYKQQSQNINLASENNFNTQAEKIIVNNDGGNKTHFESQSVVREVQNSIKRCYQKMLVTDNLATNAVTDISQSVNKSSEELNDAVNVLAYHSRNSEQGSSKTVHQVNNSSVQPDTMTSVKSVQGEHANARDSVSSQATRNNVQMMTTRPSSEQISSCSSNLNENGFTAAHRVDATQYQLGSLQPIISLVEQMGASHHKQIGHTLPERAQVQVHSEDETRRSFPPSGQWQNGCTLSGQLQSQNGGVLPGQSQLHSGCLVTGQPQSQPKCQLSAQPPQWQQSQPGCQSQGQTQRQQQSHHQQSQLGCQPPGRQQMQQQLQQQQQQPQLGCQPPGRPQVQQQSQQQQQQQQLQQLQLACQPPGRPQVQQQSQQQQQQQQQLQLACQPPGRPQVQQQSQQQQQQQLQLACQPPGRPQVQQQSQQQQLQLGCQPPGRPQVQQQSQQQQQQQPQLQLGRQPSGRPQVQQQSQQQQPQLQLGCQPPGQPQMMPQHGCPPHCQEWRRQQQQSQPGCLPLGQLQQHWSPSNQQQHGGVTSGTLQFGVTTSNLKQILIRYQNPQNGSAPTSNPSQLQGACLLPYTSQPQVRCPPPYSSYVQMGLPPPYQNRTHMEQLPSKQRPQQESHSTSNWSQLPSYHTQQQYGALHSSMANCKAQGQVVNGYQSSNLNLPSSQNFPQPGNVPANQSQAQWGHLPLNSNTVQAGCVPLEQTRIGCIPSTSNQPPIETSRANDLQVRQLRQVPSYVNRSHTGNQPTNQENTNHHVLSQTFPQQMSHSTTQVSQVPSARAQATQMVYQDKLHYIASKPEQNQPVASTVPQGSQLPPLSVQGGKVPSHLTNSVIVGHTSTSCGTTNRVTPQHTTAAACPSKVVPDSHFVSAQAVTVQSGRTQTTLVRTPQNTFQSAPNGTMTGVLRSHLEGRQEYLGTYNSSSSVESQVNSVTCPAVIQNSGVKETPSADENRNYMSTITGITNFPAQANQPEKQQESRLQQIEQQSKKTTSAIQGIRVTNSGPQQNVTSTSSVQVTSVCQQTINSRTQMMDVPSSNCGSIVPTSGNLTAEHSNANCAVVNSQVQKSYRRAAVWEVPNSSQQVICQTVSQNSVAVSPGEHSHKQVHVSRHHPNILNKQSVNKKDLLARVSNEASAVKSGMLHETNSENNKIPSNSSVPSVPQPATSKSVFITLRNLLRSAPDISVTAVGSVSKKTPFTGADKDQHTSHEMVPVPAVASNSTDSSVSVKAKTDKLSPQVYTETTVTSALSGTKVMNSGSISCHPVSTQSLVSHDYAAVSQSVNDSSNANSVNEGGRLHSPEHPDGLHVSCTTVEKPSTPLLTHCDGRTELSHVIEKETNLNSISNNENCLPTSVTERSAKMGINFRENAVQHQIPAASGVISYSSKLVGKIPSNHEESSSSSTLVYNKNSLGSGCASHAITPPEMSSKSIADSEILVSEAHAVRSSAVSVNTALNSPTNTMSSGNATVTNNSSTIEKQCKAIPGIISSKELESCKHLARNKSEVVCELQGNPTCDSETIHSADGESTSTARVANVSVTCASKYIVPETDDTAQESNKQINEDSDSDCFPAENDVQCTTQVLTSENISNEAEGMEELEVREFIESDLSFNSEMSIKLMSRVCFDTKRELVTDSAHSEISERRNHCAEAVPADLNTVNKNIKISLEKKSEVNIDTLAVAGSTATMDNALNSATKVMCTGNGTDRENSSVTEKTDNTMSKSVTPLSVSSRQSQDCYVDISDVKRAEQHCSLEDDEIEIIEDYSPVQFIGYKFAKDKEVRKTSSGSQHITDKNVSSKSADVDSLMKAEVVIGGNTAEETGSKDTDNETTESQSLKIVSVVSLTPRATGESDIQWPSSPEPRTVSRDSGYTTPSDGAAHDAQEIHVDGDINCAFCTNTAQILCTGCYITCYCSTDCQIRHWREVHFEECKLQMLVK